jgi:hypothetical protein
VCSRVLPQNAYDITHECVESHRGINGDAIEETPSLRKHNHAGDVSMNIPLRDGEDSHELERASKIVGLLIVSGGYVVL